MCNQLLNSIYIVSLAWVVSSVAFSLPVQTPFQQLRQKFEEGQVFHARFIQKTLDSFTGNKYKRSGELWVAKNAYKVLSGQQQISVNGKISTVYDHKKNRVIISNYDPRDDDFAPSRFLNGVDSTYSIAAQGKAGGGRFFIKFHSDDPFSVFKKVAITLGKQSIPEKLKVVDSANNQITTIFSDGSFVPRKPDMFTLRYPDSVRIIDMRK
jgi:outer membrane lipoprotein-sorting protein